MENGEWDIITISRAKGGIGLTALGEFSKIEQKTT